MNFGCVVGGEKFRQIQLCVAVVLIDFEDDMILDNLVCLHHRGRDWDVTLGEHLALIAGVQKYREYLRKNRKPTFTVRWFIDGPEIISRRPRFAEWRRQYIEKVFNASTTAPVHTPNAVNEVQTPQMIAKAWAKSIFHTQLKEEDANFPHLAINDSAFHLTTPTKKGLLHSEHWPAIFAPDKTREIISKSTRWAP